jgi:hypothetical protein
MFIRREIINGNLDELINQLLNNGTLNLIIEKDNIKYEITTTNNNNNEYKNISIIQFGECLVILKTYYHIDKNE